MQYIRIHHGIVAKRGYVFLDFCASFCVEVENCSEYMLPRRLTRPSQRPDSAPAWQRGSSGDICAPDHRGRAWLVLLQRVRTVQLSLHGGKSCWANARPHWHPVKCSHNDGERSRSVWNVVWLPFLHISELAFRAAPCASWDSGPDKPVTLACSQHEPWVLRPAQGFILASHPQKGKSNPRT